MNSDALECIQHHVWSGFYTESEILEIITEEAFEPGEINKDEANNAITAELIRKSQEEVIWPAETDCDKLDRAFSELNAMGVIALQNAGYTQSDGMEDMVEQYDELGGDTSPVIGYSFYHGQDLERAVRGEGLMLTFGDINGEDEKGEKIGQIIHDTLRKAGFNVEWDGTINKRIEIKNLDWKKRGPAVNLQSKKPWWKVW